MTAVEPKLALHALRFDRDIKFIPDADAKTHLRKQRRDPRKKRQRRGGVQRNLIFNLVRA